MQKTEAAMILAGVMPEEQRQASAPTNLHVITGTIAGKSENGKTKVLLEGLVFTADDTQYIEVDTLGGLEEGDVATILLTGEPGRAMTPLAVGAPGSIDRIDVRIKSIEADYIKATVLDAEIARLGYLQADSAVIKELEAGKAYIDDLTANNITVNRIVANSAYIKELELDGITADEITAATGYIDDLTAKNITADKIEAASGYIDDLTASNITAGNIAADHATVGQLDTTYATIGSLNAEQARVDNLLAGKASVGDLTAANGRIDNLESTKADISVLESDYITAKTIEANYVKTDLSNTNVAWIQNGVIKDGSISNAMINDVSANKLTAGTINGEVINVTNLNADNITAGTINGQRIGEGSLSLDKLSEDVYTEQEVDNKLATMQAEIDGAIETWTGTTVPTLNNSPASDWKTSDERDRHVGDVYFVVNSQSQQNGYNYRFTKSGSTYSWQLIKDSDVTNALQRLSTAEGKITTFDSDISKLKTDTGTLTTKTESLETRMSDAEEDILDKVDTTTFNEVSDTVDQHSQTITQMSQTLSNKADGSTVTSLTQRVSKNEQDITGINTTIGELSTTVESKADSSTVETVSSKLNTVSNTVDGHTQSISSISSTQTTMQGKLDKTIVESTQLWYTKANTTAPSKPTSQVTSTSTSGGAWRTVVPAYSSSYPNYFYCYQWKYSDGTYGWSSVTRDIAMGESQSTSRTAASDASTAKTDAATAVSTANTASTNASDALTKANTADTNASTALSTANTAAGDAATAKSDAATAVSTANTASTDASTAVSTANTAKATADKNVKSTVQLWYTKANETAPNKPTSKVTSTSLSGNGWRTVVPTYSASYPYYFYCYQYELADGTYTWSDVVYDRATTENQSNSRSAVSGVSTLTTKTNTISDTVDGHTSQLSSITETQTTIQGSAVKSTVQLWFTKSNTTAPAKPTTHVTTNNASTANAWNLAVPTYNSSYPYYYYCYEHQLLNDTYTWSAVTRDIATEESQSTSRSAKATADKNVKESQQLWYTKANSTAPSKPTSKVTSTATSGGAWTTRVPTYSDSYKHYFYCMQYVAADGTVTWSDVVYDQATTEAQSVARAASADLTEFHQEYATFKQTTQEFESTVGETYATKTELKTTDDKIENLEIGGRNLFGYGSECESLAGFYITGAWNIVTKDGFTCAHVSGALKTTKNLFSKIPFKPKPEEYVTISAYVQINDIVQGTTNPMCEFYPSGQTLNGAWRAPSPKAIYIDGTKKESTPSIKFNNNITDTSWHHFAVVYQWPNYEFTANLPPSVYFRDCTGDLYVHHIKYERGNRATDWTPAPEDIESQVSSIEERVSTAETSIMNNSREIGLRAKATDVYTKTEADGLISTEVTNRNAAITESANTINLSVSQNYTTKTEFNNLKIGGRNLLLGSEALDGFTHTGNVSISNGILTLPGNSSSWEHSHTSFVPFNEVDGNDVTFSFEYKASLPAFAYFVAEGTASNTPEVVRTKYKDHTTTLDAASEWTKWSITFSGMSLAYLSQGSGDVNYFRVALYNRTDASNIQIRHPKIERSNKATDWSPAPEDIEAYADTQISAAKSEIKVTTDGISSTVSKISSVKYVNASAASWPLASLKIYAAEGHSEGWNVTSTDGLRVGDTVYVKGTDGTRSCTVYIKTTVTSIENATHFTGTSHGYEDVLPVDTIKSTINQSSDSVKIQAKHVEIDGAAIFSNTEFRQAADDAYDSKGSASAVQTNLDNLEIGGRNLYAFTNASTGYIRSSSPMGDVVLTPTSPQHTTSDYIPVSPGDVYTVQLWNPNLIANSSNSNRSVCWYNSSKEYISIQSATGDGDGSRPNGALHWSFTLDPAPANAAYARFGFIIGPSTNTVDTDIKVKVEKGNKATDWAPAPEDVSSSIDSVYDKIRSQGIQLVTNGNGFMRDNTNWPGLRFDGTKANGSPGSFTKSVGYTTTFSDEAFPVDVSKEYIFEFDAMSDGGTGVLWSFLATLDSDKNLIDAFNVMYYQNTLTTLASDLNPGDTTVKLTSAANFVTTTATHQRTLTFWDYSNSSGYTYPAETYSRNVYSNIYADDSKVNKSTGVITLKSAWTGPKKAAGTQVSQGHSGGTYVYSHAGIKIPSTWTHYSALISGLDTVKNGSDETGKFRQGTAFAKVGFLWNYNNSDQGQIWVTNISVKEASASLSNAVKRTQRIWYRKSASGAPATPGTASSNWVVKADDGSNAWTKMHVAISSTEKFIYTCEQYEMGDGTVGYTSVLLDNTITVIDGGKIITGSVTANQLSANAVTAEKIAANALTLGKFTAADKLLVDNSQVHVGGRNLLYNTADWSKWAKTSKATESGEVLTCTNTDTSAFQRANGWFTLDKSDLLNREIVVSFDAMKTDATDLGTLCFQLFTTSAAPKSVTSGNIAEGTRFFTALSSTPTNATIENAGNINSSTWARVSVKFIPSKVLAGNYTDMAYLAVYVGIRNVVGSAQFRRIKAEFGNRATDWTPAPEDVTDSINVVSDAVSDAADGLANSIADLSGSLEQTNSRLTDLTKAVNDADADRAKWIRADDNGLTIGAVDSDYNLVLDNNSVDFKIGDQLAATASVDAFIPTALRLGDYVLSGSGGYLYIDYQPLT